jgi:S-adenosylmethionine uptake transporter
VTAAPNPIRAFFAAAAGIAVFCCMDALMKAAGLAIGAYSALLWRNLFGTALTGAAFFVSRGAMPPAARLRLHAARGVVVAGMAFLWFHGITLVPLAEAVAITFVAPLLAVFGAALFLGERVRKEALVGSVLALAGVATILLGRFGQPYGPGATEGVAAVIGSALLYAVNLVLQRHQAQKAGPAEIAFFQSATVVLCLTPFAPWAAVLPGADEQPLLAAAAVFASLSLWLLSWAYARAEAQQLIATEYTAFLWLAILGWAFFAEPLAPAVLGGAVLIVSGCLLALRRGRAAEPVPA